MLLGGDQQVRSKGHRYTLLKKEYPQSIIDVLDQTAAQWKIICSSQYACGDPPKDDKNKN